VTGTVPPGGQPPPGEDAGGRPVLPRTLQIGDGAGVGALYPELYYASLPAIAALPASELVDAVRRGQPESVPVTRTGPAGPGRGPYPSAQLAVSLDPPERFDPELSMREPLELQVWPDGSLTVEIEFGGDDVRAAPGAGDVLGKALAEWADARSWRLDAVYNDRGRSLPDVWNARFLMLDTSAPVGSAVEFGSRAIFVAESCRTGGHTVQRLLALLRAGDAHALLAAPATAVFQARPGPPPDDEAGRFELASDVCAFANSVHGGLLVLGMEPAVGGTGNRAAAVQPFPAGQAAGRVSDIVASMVFPEPAELVVEMVPAAPAGPETEGLIVIAVPPQDRVLKPFLVHGTLIGDRYQAQFASIVERRGITIYAQPIAALHAQIAAGRALLRRGPGGDDD
jgi:hypothetical protein